MINFQRFRFSFKFTVFSELSSPFGSNFVEQAAAAKKNTDTNEAPKRRRRKKIKITSDGTTCTMTIGKSKNTPRCVRKCRGMEKMSWWQMIQRALVRIRCWRVRRKGSRRSSVWVNRICFVLRRLHVFVFDGSCYISLLYVPCIRLHHHRTRQEKFPVHHCEGELPLAKSRRHHKSQSHHDWTKSAPVARTHAMCRQAISIN